MNSRISRLYAPSAIFFTATLLVSCGSSQQPNWAAEHAAARNQSVIAASKRTFLLQPFKKRDGKLDLEMLRIERDGTLIVRSTYGIESLPPGKQVLLRGMFVRVIDSDPGTQTAVVESWPRL